MGVITNAPNGSLVGSGGIHESTRECVAWKNFMVNSGGFILAGSASLGLGGGMDGVDRILNNDDFIVGSWYVIEAPDSSYQILVSKVNQGDSFQRLFINFASDWEGGNYGVEPTSPSNSSWFWGVSRNRLDTFTPEGKIYCCVEDQPPYRFFWVGTQTSSSESDMDGGMALVTFSNVPSGIPNYGLIYTSRYDYDDWRKYLKVVQPTNTANFASRNLTVITALLYIYDFGIALPNGVNTLVDNYKYTIMRVACGDGSVNGIPPIYFGEIEWIRFNGNNQPNYQHLDDANFIQFDDTVVPWNGIAIDKAKFS